MSINRVIRRATRVRRGMLRWRFLAIRWRVVLMDRRLIIFFLIVAAAAVLLLLLTKYTNIVVCKIIS